MRETVYDGGKVRTVEVIKWEGADYAVLSTTYQPLVPASKKTQEKYGVKRSIRYANKAFSERGAR